MASFTAALRGEGKKNVNKKYIYKIKSLKIDISHNNQWCRKNKPNTANTENLYINVLIELLIIIKFKLIVNN